MFITCINDIVHKWCLKQHVYDIILALSKCKQYFLICLFPKHHLLICSLKTGKITYQEVTSCYVWMVEFQVTLLSYFCFSVFPKLSVINLLLF